MFTKTIKKYMGLGLVLAFCSAPSLAAEYTKTFTPEQYQPLSFALGGVGGFAVTGTTVTGCAAPAQIVFPPIDVTAETPLALVLSETYVRSQAMEIITKAKAAGKSITVFYHNDNTEFPSLCQIGGVYML